jgi:hypothetical protein
MQNLISKANMNHEVITEGPGAIPECEGAALGVLIWLPADAGPRLAQFNGYVFVDARHKLIFEGIVSLGRKGQMADLANVIEYLTEKGAIERAGGAGYLHHIVDTACTNGAYRFGDYVRALRGNEECRRRDESYQLNQLNELNQLNGMKKMGDELRERCEFKIEDARMTEEDASRVEFPEVRAWEEPVDGATLLNELRDCLLRYVVLPPGAAEILALWILHTYAYRLRRVTTYLAIVSPEKRCGKTTLLTVLSALAHRALLASNVSPPSIFHAIEEVEPTLLIDEGDTFLQGKHQLRGILNAGYTRESAFVLRVESRRQKPPQRHEGAQSERLHGRRLAKFSCWCPKVIASIGGLPETLADRCIAIVMKRKSPAEKTRRFRGFPDNSLARKCVRFVSDHAAEIRAAEPVMPEELNDRAADIREPLFVLADLAGGEWPELVRKATVSRRNAGAEMDLSALLLSDLQAIFQTSGVQRMHSRQMVEELIEMEDRSWSRARRGGPIDELWLANKLRAYGIRPRVMRTAGGLGRGYDREEFADVFERYAV